MQSPTPPTNSARQPASPRYCATVSIRPVVASKPLKHDCLLSLLNIKLGDFAVNTSDQVRLQECRRVRRKDNGRQIPSVRIQHGIDRRWMHEANYVFSMVQRVPSLGIYISAPDRLELIDQDGRTPLSWAAGNGDEYGVMFLLVMNHIYRQRQNSETRVAEISISDILWQFEPRSDVESVVEDTCGNHAPFTSQSGHEEDTEVLTFYSGIDLNSQDNFGQTPLSWAARNGRKRTTQLLLGDDGVDPDMKDYNDQTPLSWAAQRGHDQVIQAILSKSWVNVNSKDKSGRTPLLYAIENGHLFASRLLLTVDGVDINAQDNNGNTSLLWAVRLKMEAITDMLLNREDIQIAVQNKDGQSPLFWAIQKGYQPTVERLLSLGDDPNSPDALGRGPLFWATKYCDYRIAKLLVTNYGANPHSPDHRGETPLAYALQNNDQEMVDLFFEEQDVRFSVADYTGSSILSSAIQNGFLDIAKALMSNKTVNLNEKFMGKAPLSSAIRLGYLEIATSLLENDHVNPSEKDNYEGRTPLSIAAEKGYLNIAKALLDKKHVAVAILLNCSLITSVILMTKMKEARRRSSWQ